MTKQPRCQHFPVDIRFVSDAAAARKYMSTIAVGDEVALPQGHRAILRWIGRIPGRTPVEYAGVEVLGPDAEQLGKHSGTYQGQQLFKTSRPGTGLFVSYTQLVGANVKSSRVETPRASRSVAVMSPAAYDTISPSPRYHKPPMMRAQSLMTGTGAEDANLIADDASSKSMAGQLEQLRVECEKLREDRLADRKAFEMKRADFRETLRVVNERLGQYSSEYEVRVAEIRDEYEMKLKSARRSSSLMANAGGSEVQEQRLALAAMQNKLVSERSEKQQEIDKLKRELAHVRQVNGGAEDLEGLVADLSSMEQQLKDMRSKVDQMDVLQRELEGVRIRNAELELAVQSGAPQNQLEHDVVRRDEYVRLEQALEMRLLRESELEAQNEQLQTEIAQLRERDLNVEARDNNSNNKTPYNANEQERKSSETDAGENPLNEQRKISNRYGRDFSSLKNDSGATENASSIDGNRHGLDNSVVKEDAVHTTRSKTSVAGDSWDLTTDIPIDVKSSSSGAHNNSSPSALAADESNTSQFADLAAGRKDWCSLCERQGHSAIDCPFI